MDTTSDILCTQKDAMLSNVILSPEASISLLGFSQRSLKALIKFGYDTIEKVLTLEEKSLNAIENLGKKSIKEIITIQERLQQESITIQEENFEKKNIPDCRFIYTREIIYPTDYIGILNISIEAHNVLYNAGIFSVGKLFDMEEEAIRNLKNVNTEIFKELLAFITKEKPSLGKAAGDEDLVNYMQKMMQEQQDYRMTILEESYKKIPKDRLDKPLSLFLQSYDVKNTKNFIIHFSSILKKVKKVSEIKKTFPIVVKTSMTNNMVHIQKLLSLDLVELLNKTFRPFFTDSRYTASLEILTQRANGFTLQNIAEKRKLTRERIRQLELKSTNKLNGIIKALPINIVTFICAEASRNDYISGAAILEYLEKFEYNSQILYLLENDNMYKEYQYNRQYDLFYRSDLELDFSSLDIQRPIKELVLNEREVEIGKRIEDFLIAKNLAKCTYDDICDFADNEEGYVRIGKIIQLTKNIVEIEKDWYVHRSCIIDFDEAAEKILGILKNQFKQFYGYSDIHVLFDAVCIDLAMFMNDNGFETEQIIYMITKHLFFKEKYNNYNFFFTENLHIWENQTDFPQNSKGVLINLARATGGIIIREETEKYLENLKLSKNIIINKIHDISDSTFYFYEETIYILSQCLQIDDVFVSNIKKSLDKLLANSDYIIPGDIEENWFDTLPELPLGLSWNLLLLQEIIRYNSETGFKPLFSDIEQSPYRISGAFVRIDSIITLIDIIYNYTHKNFGLPYKDTTENYRKLLRKAGFIHDSEWFTGMHKVFNDPRFVFSNENKNILVRK